MSSHHFVKEGQEPALFIVDALGLTLVEPLLEWAPLVVVSNNALDEVLRWGIKVDVVFSPVDEVLENQQKVIEQEPVQLVSYLPEGDLLQSVILFLIGTQQKATNLVAHLREEHFQLTKTFPQHQIVLIDQHLKWTYHASGNYSKWLSQKSRIHLKKNFLGQTFVMQGLQETDHSFEALSDGLVNIESAEVFWVGEPL
jgi:hypothetical protein